MRIGRLIVGAYCAGLDFDYGCDREDDPKTTVVWAYLGFFCVCFGWTETGWIYPHECTAERASTILASALPTPAFTDEWDRLEASERQP